PELAPGGSHGAPKPRVLAARPRGLLNGCRPAGDPSLSRTLVLLWYQSAATGHAVAAATPLCGVLAARPRGRRFPAPRRPGSPPSDLGRQPSIWRRLKRAGGCPSPFFPTHSAGSADGLKRRGA